VVAPRACKLSPWRRIAEAFAMKGTVTANAAHRCRIACCFPQHECSAVTAACMLIRRTKYLGAGRMDEVPPLPFHGSNSELAKGGSFCAMEERALNVYDLDASKTGTSSSVQPVVQGSPLETSQTGPPSMSRRLAVACFFIQPDIATTSENVHRCSATFGIWSRRSCAGLFLGFRRAACEDF
jgi:hypothetical protein